jgi:hypothetical protein
LGKKLYTKGGKIHKTITKHRILKIANNIQNKKTNIKGILKHLNKRLQWYLPNEREVINGSSARHSTVQYMVLAVLGGKLNVNMCGF